MTEKDLFWFKCPICNTSFLSYVNGYYLNCYFVGYDHELGSCFYDYNLGEIHNITYLNPLKNIRKCQKCSKANQLEEFI